MLPDVAALASVGAIENTETEVPGAITQTGHYWTHPVTDPGTEGHNLGIFLSLC